MSHIYRELQDYFDQKKQENRPFGFIVSGIVGSGKTTVIEKILEGFSDDYVIFQFTGDDIQFRKAVAEDSKYLLNYVQSRTNQKSLVFIDEVQKTEEVFDGLKILFDSKQVSFIVSGSNPAYLSTIAKKRLQRRAEQLYLLPFSIQELLHAEGFLQKNDLYLFKKIIFQADNLKDIKMPSLTITSKVKDVCDLFLNYGGLPLSYASGSEELKLKEIRLVVERGFELLSVNNSAINESIRLELANLSSREFSYQNILNKVRLRKRDEVNKVIDDLINHGYLVKKSPTLLKKNKSSYLSVFSYIDPGILNYLCGGKPNEIDKGFWLESYIHARLDSYVKNSVYKTEIGYFKFHDIDINDKIKYKSGEIDFVLKQGKKILPIEVKLTNQISNIQNQNMIQFLKEHANSPFAVIVYGGIPHLDAPNKIIYWPYWLL